MYIVERDKSQAGVIKRLLFRNWFFTTSVGLSSPEIRTVLLVGGITFGAIAAALGTMAGASGLLNWVSQGKGITFHRTWVGISWISW